MTTFENEIEIIEGTLDLDLARINRDYTYGMGMAIVTDHIYEYCMTESDNGGQGIISRMIDAIVKFIQSINEKVASLFKKDDHIDIEAFLKSQTGQVQLQYDVEAINADVEKQLLEGRKIIQAISSVTGISDAKVAKYCDTCTRLVEKHGGAIVKFAAIGAVRAYVSHNFLNGIDEKISNWRGVDSHMQAFNKTAAQIDADNAIKTANKRKAKAAKKAAKQEAQAQRVVNATSVMLKNAAAAKSKVASQISSIYNSARNSMKKDSKK